MIDSTTMNGTKARDASGSIGRLNRMKPYVPIFRRTAAKMTEPAVGGSGCGARNPTGDGEHGTLIANPRKKARKTHHCKPYGRFNVYIWVTSKEWAEVAVGGVWKYTARMPKSMTTLPTNVYRKNLIAE